MKKIFFFVGTLLSTSLIVSCSDDDTIEPINQGIETDFIQNYAQIVAANYQDAYTTSVTMKNKIDALIASPNVTTLKEAKAAWLYARDFYGQTEAFREANGPIDNENLLATEGQINAWPLDEAYIDYVSDNMGGFVQNGLIGDTDFEITEANILDKNELGKDDNISTGWHAIEFLLWGQDLNLNNDYSSSGDRPVSDFTTDGFAKRRKDYLETVTNLLVKDLRDLRDTWIIGGNYRTLFTNLNEDEALTNILNGIGFISNGEVALERIDPAIDEGQENEHSCFSDNTNQDMWANVYGINNIIEGNYKKEDGSTVSGVSLIELVETLDPVVSSDLTVKAAKTRKKLKAMLDLNQPFDQIISNEYIGSNGPAGQLSNALKAQGKAIAESANILSITISIN